jgi:alpha-glucuronidase
VLVLAGGLTAFAQTADQAWLRYDGYHGRTAIPLRVRVLGSGVLEQSAASELQRRIDGLAGASSVISNSAVTGEIILGTTDEIHKAYAQLPIPDDLEPEGYWLSWHEAGDHPMLIIAGADERGILYGVFDLLRRLASD